MQHVRSVETAEVIWQRDTQQTQEQRDQLLPNENFVWKYLKTLSSLFWKEKPNTVSPARVSHEDSANKPTAQQYEFFWPQNLPETCPRARVMTFGYDSKDLDVFRGKIDQNALYDHAKDLLEVLVRKRTNAVRIMMSVLVHPTHLSKQQDRPIIFVAHCVGGMLYRSSLCPRFSLISS